MAISLKQLYLLNEYWTTTDFTHPDTGEKETAQHWEPQSGKKMYTSPDIDVTKRAAGDSKVREKSTQMFYDFYAMELLHALLGSTKEMPTGAKIRATLPTAARTGINPALIGIDWDNVTFPLSNVVLPSKFRNQIDTMYEEVTIALSHKLQEHLRRSLIQELRHLINHSSQWQRFRNEIVSHYNKNKTLAKEDFIKIVKQYLPDMSNHLDAVKRLLLFSRHYSSMGHDDPGNIVTKNDPKLSKGKDDPSKYYDIEKEPSAVDISKKKTDEPEEEPGEEIPDYPGWEPESGEFDPEDPFSKKIKKQRKDSIKEDYASGKISPSTIRKINIAINKAGVKWEDVVLAYNNIAWNGGYGGEKWGEGVVSYLKLVQASKTQDVDKMAAIIDHIYDLAHNNGPLLNKGGMYVSSEDLDRRSKVTHIARFLPNVSSQVKQLLLRFMQYLPGTNVEVEKNIDTFLNAPSIAFTPEQQKILFAYKLVQSQESFIAKAPFTNKQGNYVDRIFVVKAHTNGKFTIADSIKADSKVFDNFEELQDYIKNVISKDIDPMSSSSSSPSTQSSQTLAAEVNNYINSHTRVKLPSTQAQALLDYCKMGWREKGKYYKAYFNGSKRAMFYKFSDGTYLAVTNEYKSFNPTTTWDAVFEFTKALTKDAIPYPELENAKAHIAAGTSTAPIETPPSTTVTPHPTGGFVAPPAEPQASVTPSAYPTIANQLPPHSTAPNAYFAHIGIKFPPTKSIRLTGPDEEDMQNIGFHPEMYSGMVWYIHNGTGDVVKFYPNNTAKLLFTAHADPTAKTSLPTITFTIQKMLQWLAQKYNNKTTTSPIVAQMPKPNSSTPTEPPATGINPGALFNPLLNKVGFIWDESSGKYFDGQNSLLIFPDRSSILDIYQGHQKIFKNLPELFTYLNSEYSTQKKTSSVESSYILSNSQIEEIKKHLDTIPDWNAEQHFGTALINRLDPFLKQYTTRYVISKNENVFKLSSASNGKIIESSKLFGVVLTTLIDRIKSENITPGPRPNDQKTSELPPVSLTKYTYTKLEEEYINNIITPYNLSAFISNDGTYVQINENNKPIYYLVKNDGYYQIKNISEKILGSTVDFSTHIYELKKFLNLNTGWYNSEPESSSNPNQNYQALANELIAEVATALGTSPKSVATVLSFNNTAYVIQVIKAIRTFYKNNNLEQGLVAAKLAAWHWQDFLSYIRDNGLPSLAEGEASIFEKNVIGYRTKKNTKGGPTLDKLISELVKSTGLTSDAVLNNHLGEGSVDTKITAIKTLRMFYVKYELGSSLASAKTAIEHWPNFITYIKDVGFPYAGTPFFEKALNYSPSPSSSSSSSKLTLTESEKEWISTFFKNNYPHLEVDVAPDGMIFINQPDSNTINELTKGYKSFVIIYKSSPTTYVFRQVSTGEQQAFKSFNGLATFINNNIKKIISSTESLSQEKTWEKSLSRISDYDGVNMEGTHINNTLNYNGFIWNEKHKVYINKDLYQFVCIKPQTGFNSYHIYWVSKSGALKLKNTFDVNEVYHAIGENGSIIKQETELDMGSKKPGSHISPHTPSLSQEKLLKRLGFVKDIEKDSSGDSITYTKPSNDHVDAYFSIEISAYTGKTEYNEVDEGGTSEGYTYPSIGHALTFLQNKFASELNNNDDDDDDDIYTESDKIEHITEKLAKIGFHYNNNNDNIYEYFTPDSSEFVSYNPEIGNIVYSVTSTTGNVYDVKKSFFEIDDFVNYYLSNKKAKTPYSRLSFIEKFGFKLIENTDEVIQWERESTDGDINSYYVALIKSSNIIKYEVANSNTEETVWKKSFGDIESAIEFLKFRFDFQPPQNVPYSGVDYKVLNLSLNNSPYQPIRLNQFDEGVLNDIGFEYKSQIVIGNVKIGDQIIYNEGYKDSLGRKIFFYADGTAIYHMSIVDPGTKWNDIKTLLGYLWQTTDWSKVPEFKKKNIKWKSHAKPVIPTKSGDMPYSGYDYSLLSSLYDQSPIQSTFISQADENVMTKMGFVRKTEDTTDIPFQRFYEKGREKMYFFSDGRASYWDGTDGPKYFNTVKEGMQFLWNKHTPYIEEIATYKNFMKNWLQ